MTTITAPHAAPVSFVKQAAPIVSTRRIDTTSLVLGIAAAASLAASVCGGLLLAVIG